MMVHLVTQMVAGWICIWLLLRCRGLLPSPAIMGEILKDYSWIQDFEADFPSKVNAELGKL